MEFLKQTRFIERQQFFNGQRLFASDLDGVEAFNREMRWLHNKSLHQPGIGNGFAVSGKKGEREVTVGPGYAIDAMGREIVLLENQVEPVPPVAGQSDGSPVSYYLTVSYPDDRDLEETERREGICDTRGAIRLREQPVLCWVELRDGQPLDDNIKQEIIGGMRLVVAEAEVLNCQLNKDLSIAQRLSARPPKQPYICCGRTEEKEPKWQMKMLADFDTAKIVSSKEWKQLLSVLGTAISFFPIIAPARLEMTINTSECGFKTTPCYTARVVGPRVKQITDATLETLGFKAASSDRSSTRPGLSRSFQTSFIVDGPVEVVESKPDHFTINVLLMVQHLFGVRADSDVNAMDGLGQAMKGSQASGTDTSGAATGEADATKTVQPADVQAFLDKVVEAFFSNWIVEWMGIEG